MAALHHRTDGQAGILSTGPATQNARAVLEAERITQHATMRADETVRPAGPLQIGGAGRIVRKKPQEPRKRFRKPKVGSVENVHGHLLPALSPYYMLGC